MDGGVPSRQFLSAGATTTSSPRKGVRFLLLARVRLDNSPANTTGTHTHTHTRLCFASTISGNNRSRVREQADDKIGCSRAPWNSNHRLAGFCEKRHAKRDFWRANVSSLDGVRCVERRGETNANNFEPVDKIDSKVSVSNSVRRSNDVRFASGQRTCPLHRLPAPISAERQVK